MHWAADVMWGDVGRQTADMLPEKVTCGCNETVASSSISISASSARASRPAPCHVSRTISSAHVATCVTLHVIIFLQNYGEHAGLVTRSRGNVKLHGRVSSRSSGLLVMSFVHLSTYINCFHISVQLLFHCRTPYFTHRIVSFWRWEKHIDATSICDEILRSQNCKLWVILIFYKIQGDTNLLKLYLLQWGTSLQSNEESAVTLQERKKAPHSHDTQLTADFSRRWIRWPRLYPQLSGG